MNKLKNIFKPAILIVFFSLLTGGLYYLGCFEYFKWSVWQEIHGDIKQFVLMNIGISIILGCLFYLIGILTFLPGMLLFDLLIGYMFPQLIGVLIILCTSTVAALLIVFGCRFGFKNLFMKKDGKFLQKIQKGFAENETMYLLFLRFVPFFPFALVSAALASLPISYKKIAWTTFIGMIPVAFILTSVGKSFGLLMKLDTMPKITQLISPTIMIAIIGLSVLCFIPLIIKRFVKIR